MSTNPKSPPCAVAPGGGCEEAPALSPNKAGLVMGKGKVAILKMRSINQKQGACSTALQKGDTKSQLEDFKEKVVMGAFRGHIKESIQETQDVLWGMLSPLIHEVQASVKSKIASIEKADGNWGQWVVNRNEKQEQHTKEPLKSPCGKIRSKWAMHQNDKTVVFQQVKEDSGGRLYWHEVGKKQRLYGSRAVKQRLRTPMMHPALRSQFPNLLFAEVSQNSLNKNNGKRLQYEDWSGPFNLRNRWVLNGWLEWLKQKTTERSVRGEQRREVLDRWVLNWEERRNRWLKSQQALRYKGTHQMISLKTTQEALLANALWVSKVNQPWSPAWCWSSLRWLQDEQEHVFWSLEGVMSEKASTGNTTNTYVVFLWDAQKQEGYYRSESRVLGLAKTIMQPKGEKNSASEGLISCCREILLNDKGIIEISFDKEGEPLDEILEQAIEHQTLSEQNASEPSVLGGGVRR